MSGMASSPTPVVHLLSADVLGVPLTARCDCGAEWIRPDADHQAETLVLWARFLHECPLRPGGARQRDDDRGDLGVWDAFGGDR